MSDKRIQELEIASLNPSEFTYEQYRELYDLRAPQWTELGGTVQPFDQFVSPSDFAQYPLAVAWWPKAAPVRFQLPLLQSLLTLCIVRPEYGPITFAESLVNSANQAREWIEQDGGNVANPNESAEERRLRKAREAQRRLRDRRRTTGDDRAQLASKVQAAYQAYLDKCAERKAMEQAFEVEIRALWSAYKTLKGEHDNAA